MRYVIENIEADDLPAEMRRRGVPRGQRLRVVVETLDEEISIAEMNARGGAFDHLADEPEDYDDADLIERNEAFRR